MDLLCLPVPTLVIRSAKENVPCGRVCLAATRIANGRIRSWIRIRAGLRGRKAAGNRFVCRALLAALVVIYQEIDRGRRGAELAQSHGDLPAMIGAVVDDVEKMLLEQVRRGRRIGGGTSGSHETGRSPCLPQAWSGGDALPKALPVRKTSQRGVPATTPYRCSSPRR